MHLSQRLLLVLIVVSGCAHTVTHSNFSPPPPPPVLSSTEQTYPCPFVTSVLMGSRCTNHGMCSYMVLWKIMVKEPKSGVPKLWYISGGYEGEIVKCWRGLLFLFIAFS